MVNSLGTLVIESSDKGIVGKDDVKVTGSTIELSTAGKGIEANDRVLVGGGTISINASEGIEATLVQIEDGTIDITAQFAFDFVGTGALNGGTVTVNGEQVTEITNSMMEGGMGGAGQAQGGMGRPQGAQGGMR